MEINELINFVTTNMTFINLMLTLIFVAVCVIGYGLYFKVKELRKEIDDLYYLVMNIDNRMK